MALCANQSAGKTEIFKNLSQNRPKVNKAKNKNNFAACHWTAASHTAQWLVSRINSFKLRSGRLG